MDNFLRTTIIGAGAVAGICHLANSPKTEKIKKIAMGIGLAAAVIYGFMGATNASPVPKVKQSPMGSTIIEGNYTQFTLTNSPACTVIAAIALRSMLESPNQTPEQINQFLVDGVERYNRISAELDKDGAKQEGKVSLGWDQCYYKAPIWGFEQEFVTSEKPTMIRLAMGEANVQAYLNALRPLEQQALSPPVEARGAILTLGPETVAIAINPTYQGTRFRLFDSHGTFGHSEFASIIEFDSLEKLARHLHNKKEFTSDVYSDYNLCGYHPCSLKQQRYT